MTNDKLMAGIDLHSNNLFCGIVDAEGKRVFEKKLPCDLPQVLAALEPFKDRLDTIAVESTYNWYWLVDGLQDHGYKVALANPCRINQYDGLKHIDDQTDAFFLAELLRLNILPTGYLCDRQLRPVRDLLRRRLGLVRKRTSLILSLKSLFVRMTGQALSLGRLKAMNVEEVQSLFSHPADQLIAGMQLRLIHQIRQDVWDIEKAVLAVARGLPCYGLLQTLPGVGIILSLTITLETADPKRFANAGHYASYGRCVEAKRLSNGKKKDSNNGKCGNSYLGWAWVEAANFAQRFDQDCRRFYDRKKQQTNSVVATKALACKLAKAAWYIMSQGVAYDSRRMFPR